MRKNVFKIGVSSRGINEPRVSRNTAMLLSFRRNILGLSGLGIIFCLLIAAVVGPVIAPFDPYAQDLSARLSPPGTIYWLGADELGRDILSRLLYGARTTLLIVLLVVVISAPIGLVFGCTAGYIGGWLDLLLMRLTDVFLAFPRLILALALVAALGPGLENAIIAIALTSWPVYARVARAEALVIRNSHYISIAKLQGASAWRIIRMYVMPICINSTVVRVTLDMAGIILTAAGLGFLGFGATPPSSEWGAMIASGHPYIFDHWWLATVPGLAILMVSVGFNLFGAALRDVLDPRI